MTVAVVHDYLTQRGGAERVVLSLTKAFPEAVVYVSLYEPELTFPEFAALDVRTTPLNRIRPLRASHRLAFPLLAPAMSRLRVEADVVVCSSSGWAHGVATGGRKIVYCHAPARWLYQRERYSRGLGPGGRAALASLRPLLQAWDLKAAQGASRYLANSRHVAALVRETYGIDADVVPPPPALTPGGPLQAIEGIEPGFLLCVSRLLPYKNVDSVVAAFEHLEGERLVVVGDGPDEIRLHSLAGRGVRLVGSVTDAELRWLYANCSCLLAAAYEDFGLTPLEAASFGKPSAALRFGGFLDTVCEGVTGVFFDEPTPGAIAAAVVELRSRSWQPEVLRRHSARFSEDRFVARLRAIVGVDRDRGIRAAAA